MQPINTQAAHDIVPYAATEMAGNTTPPNKQCKDTAFSPNMQTFLPQNEELLADASILDPVLPTELPTWGLPDSVQHMIDTYTNVYQCPRDFVTSAVLVAAGAAAGTAQTATDGKYTNTPCLWVCIIAPSGSNKSHPVAQILQPLNRLNALLHHEYEQQIAEWKNTCEQAKYEYRQQGQTKAPKRTATIVQTDILGNSTLVQQPKPVPVTAAEQRKALILPNRPPHCQIVMSDTTPEARNQVLNDNPHGVLLYSDELRTFFDNIGRYNTSGELSQILTIYDNGDLQINRKTGTEQVMYISNPFMCMLGGIQPDILPTTFTEQMCNNGLIYRFCFVYPEQITLPPANDETIPKDIQMQWDDMIDRIFKMPEREYIFDGDAKAVLIDFINNNRIRWNATSSTDNFTASVLGKQQQHVERISLITAILNGTHTITKEHVQYAIECVGYFERTMQRVREKLAKTTKNSVKPTKTALLTQLFETYPELCEHKTELSRWLGKSDGYIRKLLNDGKEPEQPKTTSTL